MTCPKCGYENPADRTDCLQCGVIFAKIRQGPQGQAPEVPVPLAPMTVNTPPSHRSPIAELLLPEGDKDNTFQLWGRTAGMLVMIVWGGLLIFSGMENNALGENFLHLINMPFHEAGHVIFRPFGRFIASLGGTLGQLLIPLVCLAALLLKTRDPFGAAVCLWWFGENFLDIAPYINDARALQLPLLGGNFGHSSPYGFHDWEYLLTESGLLRYDHALAKASYAIGSLLMALAVVWVGCLIYRQYRQRGLVG